MSTFTVICWQYRLNLVKRHANYSSNPPNSLCSIQIMLHVKSINTMGDILLQLEQRNYCHVFHATLCNIAFPIGRKYKPFCCTHCLFQIHSNFASKSLVLTSEPFDGDFVESSGSVDFVAGNLILNDNQGMNIPMTIDQQLQSVLLYC
eukprot:579488_1